MVWGCICRNSVSNKVGFEANLKVKSKELKDVISTGDVEFRCSDTTITGKVILGGKINAIGSMVHDLQSDEEIILSKTDCKGLICSKKSISLTRSEARGIDAQEDVTLINSSVHGNTKSKTSINAQNCPSLKSLQAKTVTLENCSSVSGKISAEDFLTINNSTVFNDVEIMGKASMVKSTVHGTVTCYSNNLRLENCTVDHIIFKRPPKSSQQKLKDFLNTQSGVLTSRQFLEEEKSSGHEKDPCQELELVNCDVKTVTFENKQGTVVLKGDSVIKEKTKSAVKVISGQNSVNSMPFGNSRGIKPLSFVPGHRKNNSSIMSLESRVLEPMSPGPTPLQFMNFSVSNAK